MKDAWRSSPEPAEESAEAAQSESAREVRPSTALRAGRATRSPPEDGTVDAVAAEVDSVGGRGIAVPCDHRDDDAVEALFSAGCRKRRGRLDVLVNNAFIIPNELTSGKPFWEVPLSNWDDMIDVGTRSAYAASRLAAPMMVEQGSGLIANISSSGAAEYAWHVAYGVGKAALDRITNDTAHELDRHGVAVVSLWPGLVLTESNEANRGRVQGLDFSTAESLYFTGEQSRLWRRTRPFSNGLVARGLRAVWRTTMASRM